MRIDVFTIFPDMVGTYCGMSILGRAVAAGRGVDLVTVDSEWSDGAAAELWAGATDGRDGAELVDG